MKLLSMFLIIFFTLLQASYSAPYFDLDLLCTKLEPYHIPDANCFDFYGRDSESQHATFKELAVIGIDIVIANSTSVQARVDDLLKRETNPRAIAPLQACSKYFSDGDAVLRKARGSAAAEKFAESAAVLGEYGSLYPQHCIDEYNGEGGVNPVGSESAGLIAAANIAKSTSDVVASL